MNTISKILTGNLFWIIFFLFVVTSAQARNEYLNDGAYACERGHWETYTEVRQHEYKSGTSDEYQDQTLGFRFRMPLGAVCSDCLLYTSPSPRDRQKSRMPSSA